MEGSGRLVQAKHLNVLPYVQAFASQQLVVSLPGAAHLVPVLKCLEFDARVLLCWRAGEYAVGGAGTGGITVFPVLFYITLGTTQCEPQVFDVVQGTEPATRSAAQAVMLLPHRNALPSNTTEHGRPMYGI